MNPETEIPASFWQWLTWDIIKAETGQSNDICIGEICLQEERALETVSFISLKQQC